MPALAIYMLRTWSPRRWIASGLMTALVVLPFMLWFGKDWLYALTSMPQRGSIMDTSLLAAMNRLGLPVWGFITLWLGVFVSTAYVALKSCCLISREKAGLLISASLLLAPYSAGNNYLAVLAIGIIPLFQSRPVLGAVIIALADLPFLLLGSRDIMYRWGAYYWTTLLLLTWVILVSWVYRLESSR
jgi:hypothetical protein